LAAFALKESTCDELKVRRPEAVPVHNGESRNLKVIKIENFGQKISFCGPRFMWNINRHLN
jgi:hypothetical protein